MRKIILPVLAALVLGVSFSSCQKDEVIESMNTVWTEFTVTNDMWVVDQQTDDLVCSMQWDVLTDYVLKCGNVQAYIYEGTRQVPLPYVYPVTFTDANGDPQVRPLNIRFDFEKGIITFIVTDCGEFLTNPVNLYTMRFRAVCTYPVNYILPNDK
ncbi:MAG: hypothetical protein J6X59_04195 [Bacteroidales bacterium]|nr:hypothetical protein [Bacteroidales bacterium]